MHGLSPSLMFPKALGVPLPSEVGDGSPYGSLRDHNPQSSDRKQPPDNPPVPGTQEERALDLSPLQGYPENLALPGFVPDSLHVAGRLDTHRHPYPEVGFGSNSQAVKNIAGQEQ